MGTLTTGAAHVVGFTISGSSGNRTLTQYIDGTAGTPVTGLSDWNLSTADWSVGHRAFVGAELFMSGQVFGAMCTETELSAAEHAALARAILADQPRTTTGQLLTFSRSGSAYCATDSIVNGFDAGIAGSWLPPGRPCMRGGGILGEEARTNLVVKNTEFDHDGGWTWSNVTVTSTSQTAPDGTPLADRASVTTDGGYIESMPFVVASTNVVGSVYIAPGSSEHVRIAVHDTDAGTQVCTNTLTDANGAYQRLWCQSQTVTSGNAYTVRIYPGKVGDGAKLWCAMGEADFFPSSCIVTNGTSASRSAPTQTLSHAGLSNGAGCIGATSQSFPMNQVASSSRRILDLNGSNPLTYFSSGGQLASDDGATNVFTNFGSNAAGRAARSSFGWSGAVMTGSADTTTNSGVYDGAMFSNTTLAIGHDTGGSAFSNATIKEIRVGTSKDVCR